MGALTPEERRRVTRLRQTEGHLAATPRPTHPAAAVRPQARFPRRALLLALALAAALAAAWGLWTLLPELTFQLPASFLDWLLPPVTSRTFP